MKADCFTYARNEPGRSIRLVQKRGRWYWEYRSNGKVTARCKSEGYRSKLGCMNSVVSVRQGLAKVMGDFHGYQ